MKSLLLSVSCLVILGCGLFPAPEAIKHGCTVPDLAPVNLDFTSYLSSAIVFRDTVQGVSDDVTPRDNGVVITNVNISDQMNHLSCSTREVAIHATAAFLSPGTHTVLIIKDTSHDVMGVGLNITMDTNKSLFHLTYRHQTEPHTETISFNKDLRTRRWQQLIFVLSGNQFLFILGCEVVLSTTIAAPDLCFSSSSTIYLGDVSDKRASMAFRNNLDDVGIIFGNRGYMDICPNLKYDCATCAESLSLRQRIRELERELDQKMEEIQTLRSRQVELQDGGEVSRFRTLEFFEEFRNSDFVMRILRDSPSIAAGGVGNEDKCYLNGMILNNGRFFTHSFPNKINASCMCFFGVILCDKEVQRFQKVYYVCKNSLPANTYAIERLGSSLCRLKGCGGIGSRVNQDAFTPHRCGSTNSSQCLPLRNSKKESDGLRYRKMVCCGDCDPCEGHPCPAIASCEPNPTYGNHTCVCPEGMYHSGDQCSRLFKCWDKSTCPENSVCIEDQIKVGHFCDCTNGNTTPGFRWNNQTNTCDDVDECHEGSAKCPLLSRCVNQQGSYRCVCQDGYKKNELTGKCEAHCDPECRNGGVCLFGNICVCPSGFTGLQCQRDIDECTRSVCGENETCINTLGSYYCTCKSGYVRNGNVCENINECNDKLLNTCLEDSVQCVDTPGSFTCKCKKSGLLSDCTGMCKFRTKDIPNGDTYTNGNCRRCTCVNGVSVCGENVCDCTDRNVRNLDKCCRDICKLKWGCELPDGGRLEKNKEADTKDGCQRCTCSANEELSCTQKSCPDISYCPQNFTFHPEGACCPMCKVPRCTEDITVEHIDNGCRKCLCKDNQWTCDPPVKCLELECVEEDKVYQPGQCCPSCRVLPSPSKANCK